jgi:hypothetical protein
MYQNNISALIEYFWLSFHPPAAINGIAPTTVEMNHAEQDEAEPQGNAGQGQADLCQPRHDVPY